MIYTHSLKLTSLVATLIILAGSVSARATSPTVVTSIKPVHSLVAGVMNGIGKPGLIVDGNASPHSYSLKPSQAEMLEKAAIVFWIGPTLETFLEKPIETIAEKATNIPLIDAPGIRLLAWRQGDGFGEHDDHADHEDHNDHGEHNHGEGGMDPHIWLDPENAKAMVDAIAASLSVADAANGAKYTSNAEALKNRLDTLTVDVRTRLDPVKGKSFVVFHDGYHYFENRFGIEAAGAITLNPEVPAGAERIRDIRQRISDLSAGCVFTEPQFDPKLAALVAEGHDIRIGTLDPIGSALEPGPDLYFSLIGQMADQMANCLE